MGATEPCWAVAVVVAVICIAFGTTAPDWTDCPTACRCKWSGGKKTALCREAGFTALPASLNSDMQVLDLSGNAIPYLTKDAFKSVGLINLQRIKIRQARVREIHKDAFRDLIILIEVDLSENLVESIHPETFEGNDRLRVLYLNGNPLRQLQAAQFPVLPHLRTLELEDCKLTAIHRKAFVNVEQLESLNLKNNKLSDLSETVFMLIARLKTLALDGNPWRCDCRLRGFRTWFLASKLTSIPLRCKEPARLTGRQWEDVPAVDFACAPTVALVEDLVHAQAGDNVTFSCHVSGDPEPEVTWLYNGRIIGSGNATHPDQVLLIEVEEGLLDKWFNISLFNVSELDAGDYSCAARNTQGNITGNVTLVLPEVMIATTVSKTESWLVFGMVSGGVAALCTVLVGVACTCCLCGRERRRRKRHRRKGKLKGSISFTDQEKKLLDVSITTTERPSATDSCEVLSSQPDLDSCRAEQSPGSVQQMELCEPPVHITIESHASEAGLMQAAAPASSLSPASATGYPATLSVFPPPPEFSTSILPAGAFGNIFISVSVSQDPAGIDVQHYPDLLDIPHPARGGGKHHQAVQSVATGPDIPYCGAADAYATIPRRPRSQLPKQLSADHQESRRVPRHGPHYDNMGPRVTAGGGSCSTLSLPDADGLVVPTDIPPPPPPPNCTPHTGEFVSL